MHKRRGETERDIVGYTLHLHSSAVPFTNRLTRMRSLALCPHGIYDMLFNCFLLVSIGGTPVGVSRNRRVE